MQRFDGRVALVTGAGGGIGRAVAVRLAAEGASVVCADVDGQAARSTAEDVDGVPVLCDVTDETSVRAALATLDRLDVLANVAGIGTFRRTAEVTLAEWNRTLAVNLTGTFLMIREALPLLLDAEGAIVNMASLAGLKGTPYNAAYCASKGGVVMLTRSMAIELATTGVRVNCVCPSAVDTAFLRNFEIPDDADFALFARSAPPNGRMATPEEVASAVAYLASPEAAMVNGVAFVVDGGAMA